MMSWLLPRKRLQGALYLVLGLLSLVLLFLPKYASIQSLKAAQSDQLALINKSKAALGQPLSDLLPRQYQSYVMRSTDGFDALELSQAVRSVVSSRQGRLLNLTAEPQASFPEGLKRQTLSLQVEGDLRVISDVVMGIASTDYPFLVRDGTVMPRGGLGREDQVMNLSLVLDVWWEE